MMSEECQQMCQEGNFWLGTDYNLLKQVCEFITVLGRSRFFKELLGLGLVFFFMNIGQFQIYFNFSKNSTCGFLGHVKYPKLSIPQVNDSRFYKTHWFQIQGRASFTISSTCCSVVVRSILEIGPKWFIVQYLSLLHPIAHLDFASTSLSFKRVHEFHFHTI